MCLAVTPILPFVPLLTGGLIPPPGAVSAPQSPPQQGAQQGQQSQQNQQNDQNQQAEENPNDIQNFEDFSSRFGRTYSSLAEQSFRQDLFLESLAIINVSFKCFYLIFVCLSYLGGGTLHIYGRDLDISYSETQR